MADPRALDALNRIDRALARIEAAASRPSPPIEESLDASLFAEEHEKLREAHEQLRRKVIGAIGQIDDLISTAELR